MGGYRLGTDEMLLSDDARPILNPRTFGVPECDLCPPITSTLVAACASVGIEHGRSTGHEIHLYLAAKHAEHVAPKEPHR